MRKTFTRGLMVAGVVAATMGISFSAQAETLRVRITNLTQGQVLSPPIVIAHPAGTHVFKLGQPSSAGMIPLVEGGDPSALDDEVSAMGADTATAGGGVMPGQSAFIRIETTGNNRRISVLSMLVSTNDAFIGLDGAKPAGRYNKYFVGAYDAGTEFNNEGAAFVPGLGGGSRDTDDAEGYIYVHSGIHGIADLDPATTDWGNPVAQIQIFRGGSSK